MNLQGHFLLVGVIVTSTLSIQVSLDDRYADELRRITREAGERRMRDLARGWNSLTYTDIGVEGAVEGLLRRIDWRSLALTQGQEDDLRARLGQVISFLVSPNPTSYYLLKTDGLMFDVHVTPIALELLDQAGLLSAIDTESSPENIINIVWEANLSTRCGGKLPRLTAACLDSLNICTETINTPTSILTGKVAKAFTAGVRALQPGFVYSGKDGSPSVAGETNLFVHLSFFARSNVSEDAGPVFISVAWVNDRRWVASELFTDAMLSMYMLF